MTGLQTPALQIFIRAPSVSAVYVAAQGFAPIPAIQTNYIVVTHRLAHRNSGDEHFFHRSRNSKLAKASVHGRDEIGKLTDPDSMMSNITPDNFRREKWIDALGVHGSLLNLFSSPGII